MAILVEHPHEHVRLLTLNRPEVLNATSVADIEELDALVTDADHDPSVRCVVITGSGRAFCAGNDIHEMADRSDDGLVSMELRRRDPTLRWATAQVPRIAAVNGVAYGYGAILAIGASLRVGGRSTRFRITATRYGSANLTWNLPDLIGVSHARDLLLTSRTVDGDEAFRMGLLNRLVGDDEVVPTALALAEQIAANDAAGPRRVNALIDVAPGMSMRSRFDAEHALQIGGMRGAQGTEMFADFLDASAQRRAAST